MSIPIAFTTVVLIWSTTPLAIKWSGELTGLESDFYIGLMARMGVSALVILTILILLGKNIPWHVKARRVYFATTLHIFASMIAVYWGAQYISSGLLSVLYGTAPLATGLFAAWILKEQVFTYGKMFGLTLGILGLGVIFSDGLDQPEGYVTGVLLVLLSTTLYGLSAVLVRKYTQELDQPLTAFAINAGGIWLSVPLFIVGALFFTSEVFTPEAFSLHWERVPSKAIYSIVYLGVMGSVVGFVLYFYLIKHVDASRLSLITLITPITALFLGQIFNGETISNMVVAGTVLTLIGLASYQWGDSLLKGYLLKESRVNKKVEPVYDESE